MGDFDSDPGPKRCQVPDHVGNFVPRWGKRLLRWSIVRLIPDLGEAQIALTAAAFESWSRVCGLEFQHVDDPADAEIRIDVARGQRNQFDGQGGVLAYAYLPGSAAWSGPSQQYYDLDEKWTAAAQALRNEIRYLPTCAHESGHTLGLSHGPQGALLQPTYDPNLWEPQTWDIAEAVKRYGPPLPRRRETGPSASEAIADLREALAKAIDAAKRLDELTLQQAKR